MARINPISARQRARLLQFRLQEFEYLSRPENHFCKVCKRLVELGEKKPQKVNVAIEVHHKRGRAGALLFDERFFLPICRSCHILIDWDRGRAKREGWIESWHNTKDVDN